MVETALAAGAGRHKEPDDKGFMYGWGFEDLDGHIITHATFTLLQRDARLTHLSWNWQDLVEGHLLQFTNNADQSRTFAAIHMHDNRLYILEGTVPKGYPEPGLFQQNMGFVDKDGNGIRYQSVYSNAYHGMGEYPVPGLTGGGGAAGAVGAGAVGGVQPGTGR